ncbi:uncharacterized protein LOC125711941 isoform X3 [Brienomyrus brachyistius]|uniref:uncharacterized protein LOC125711941 isoform X3 n=1 Tax=Brienomyrus brachyistius TaxID=42636 RepID=UPI0020B219C5|nr:uncharacterized protein LOC125711941 isoform X3 [Brienomyrus brachyistius]
MLATVLTAMYLVLRAAEQVGLSLLHPDVLPYVVSQPMPWRVHYVSQSRRSSRTDEIVCTGADAVSCFTVCQHATEQWKWVRDGLALG